MTFEAPTISLHPSILALRSTIHLNISGIAFLIDLPFVVFENLSVGVGEKGEGLIHRVRNASEGRLRCLVLVIYVFDFIHPPIQVILLSIPCQKIIIRACIAFCCMSSYPKSQERISHHSPAARSSTQTRGASSKTSTYYADTQIGALLKVDWAFKRCFGRICLITWLTHVLKLALLLHRRHRLTWDRL